MQNMPSQQIQELISAESRAILGIPVTNPFQNAVDLIHQSVHGRQGKLIATGMGKAGQIALNIATTFSSTGTPAIFIHAAEAQHGDLGIIQPNDALLIVSNSGKTKEVLDLLVLTSKLFGEKLPLIIITGHPEGILAEKADVVLLTGNPPEICPLGLTPTTSTTAMTVIGDILVVMMMLRIGFTREEYAKRHHGGYLGHKSKTGEP